MLQVVENFDFFPSRRLFFIVLAIITIAHDYMLLTMLFQSIEGTGRGYNCCRRTPVVKKSTKQEG